MRRNDNLNVDGVSLNLYAIGVFLFGSIAIFKE